MPRWLLDESRTPIYVVHLDDVSGRATPDFDTLLVVLNRVTKIAAVGRCYLVLDLSGARPDAQRRQRLVTWLKDEGWAARNRIGALAIVAPSAFLRGALTAIRWFFPDRAVNSEVFETRSSALAWIERQPG